MTVMPLCFYAISKARNKKHLYYKTDQPREIGLGEILKYAFYRRKGYVNKLG